MTDTPNTGASKLAEKPPVPPLPPIEYAVHPIATVFPAMSTEEFNGLRNDIEDRGLQEPIWLYQGKILDGRHRYQACKELGITPAIKQYTGDDAVGFVLGANLHRRHLNETQRSMIAARLVTTRLGDNQHLRKEGRSIDLATAADMLNISEKSVKRAKAVCQDGAPELIALVDSGAVAVSAAEKIVGKSVEEQAEIARGGADAVYEAGRKPRATGPVVDPEPEPAPDAADIVRDLELEYGDMFEVLKKVYDRDDLVKEEPMRKCDHCNREFLPRGRNVRFCSPQVGWHVEERKVAVAYWRQMQETVEEARREDAA